MTRKLNGVELTRYDDLFKTDAEREADQQERVQIVPAEQVFPYARQPYSVDRPSADLVRLMDSIERTGIAEPLIVRPRSEGGYEIISGHRRDYCAKVVGLDTRPVIVRDYSDEDADILVVDYNINRENLLPSEKAKAYMVTKVYAHILDEDRKVNAQKFESAFYANPDLRSVKAPDEPQTALDVQSIIVQLQQSPELLSALTSLISNQGCK